MFDFGTILTRELAHQLYTQNMVGKIIFSKYEDDKLKEAWEFAHKAILDCEKAIKNLIIEVHKND